ncbi:MAG: Eco57I restriction-modification methylase domain-containing protein [Clostridiales bacterium]|nr:Eco57I restriction-modification methylase domain-containing protein [Clostridiales bacterium]
MIIGIQDEILRLHSLGLLELLLKDKTTKANILWATDAYQNMGPDYERDKEIKTDLITGEHSGVIKNRARKALEQQTERTRQHAEVFTPLWICKRMNEAADEGWFPKKNPHPFDKPEPVKFLSKTRWWRYVDARRLEITCGEAPYLVSRYDVSTGESIPIENRIGLLDHKLRVVNENTADEAEWMKWTLRAFQSIYGYEFQGDNVLIARVNLLMTFEEYLQERWRRKPTYEEYRKVANVIVWNIWQMDGLTGTIPYCKAPEEIYQLSIFDYFLDQEQVMEQEKNSQPHCRLFDWRANNSLEFLKINEGSERRMKFDFVIGNPPYQDEMEGTSDNPIYNLFMDASYSIATVVELITPARFLFNAGKTPKAWNQKMLSDEHLRVLYYEQDSSKVFFNTDIKGGVVITYRDSRNKGEAIQTFTTFSELNTILRKVRSNTEKYLSDVVYAPESYKFTKEMYADHPEILSMTMMVKGKEVPLISKGHDYDLTSNIFDKLHGIVFFDEPTENSVAIFGRMGNERVTQYIERPYIANHPNLDKYKVFFPKANGAGKFGEIMTASDIGEKNVGHTQTFISIGAFDTFEESKNLQKYLMCKLTRALLYVLKVTQDNKKSVWKYVPLQDFTPSSDIDWSKSVAEIDQQLYVKYGLDEKEIAFIESHVKEMS